MKFNEIEIPYSHNKEFAYGTHCHMIGTALMDLKGAILEEERPFCGWWLWWLMEPPLPKAVYLWMALRTYLRALGCPIFMSFQWWSGWPLWGNRRDVGTLRGHLEGCFDCSSNPDPAPHVQFNQCTKHWYTWCPLTFFQVSWRAHAASTSAGFPLTPRSATSNLAPGHTTGGCLTCVCWRQTHLAMSPMANGTLWVSKSGRIWSITCHSCGHISKRTLWNGNAVGMQAIPAIWGEDTILLTALLSPPTGVPGSQNKVFYECCREPYLDVTFAVTMRRRTLYYALNMLVPCLLLSAMTFLVFLLPADSGEKISLGKPFV